MKKTGRILIIITLIIMLLGITTSCTEQGRARQYGETVEITLPAGKRLVSATWKESNLWVLTEDMPADYTPQTKDFVESSAWGVLEGKIIFHETRTESVTPQAVKPLELYPSSTSDEETRSTELFPN